MSARILKTIVALRIITMFFTATPTISNAADLAANRSASDP